MLLPVPALSLGRFPAISPARQSAAAAAGGLEIRRQGDVTERSTEVHGAVDGVRAARH